MKLDSLEIRINNEVKRFVKFESGLNLITNKPNSGRTGNSVGKSTLSRVVDFLMLGSIDNIYIDEEFKRPNLEIEALFKNSFVTASLSFFDYSKEINKISRNLCIDEKSESKFWINGEVVEENVYELFIQDKIFNISTRRPSVRAVAPKFIRNDSHRMLSTTKFLDKRQGLKDYSELFLYLFGFNNTSLLTDKRDATNLVNRRKRNSTSINALVKEQNPKADIKKYKADAKELENSLLTFEYSSEYSNPIERLSELQVKEDRYTEELLSIHRKVDNINHTIELLSKDKEGYLINELKAIYSFSGIAIDGALRELEDVILFHRNLVEKKKHFLTIDLPKLNEESEGLQAELSSIKKDKLQVFSDLRSKESLDNVTKNLKRLGELKVELGKLEGLMEQQSKAKSDQTEAEGQLQKILEAISKEIDNVYEFEKKFNTHLRSLTKSLHDEEYSIDIDFNKDTGTCSIKLNNSATSPEGGKKKAEVIAFDFAYIHAINELKLNRPKFIFHDSIEDIDKKQIEDIFKEANKLPGQQILSMLSDKISEETYKNISKNIILSLDEDEKFFCV
ncbi:hypothetical protein VCSRO96_3347 [Vibrio cholerae]|uniref:hypothetical protein n=1 Tax=Vibrio cholerae TaxID=666 RepID=UPI00204B9308|nr:hypothetical protein [Vibrio cholerae]EKF6144327.1 DUF2326 domain-containing protein [Vibrio cholerae]EKF9617796.1 DUF2326 domain-containing protein [Vibrio cholerae]ELE0369013.1 DUF2326 domain-containing protein [Vibrio cholerae]ELL0942334.1 DUF2326 domain-containing protein [Vibrio cholerae]ELL3761122.1 DUF2326 domain-containing protein [Vibrio cholerae]